jgi:hypothetical protein
MAQVLFYNANDFLGRQDNVGSPRAKPAVLIHGVDPILQKLPLAAIFLGVLALHLDDNMFSVRQANQKVGTVLFHDALPDIENFKTEVVVLDPRINAIDAVELVGLAGFPSAVENTKIDMAFLRKLARPTRVPRPHVAGRSDGTLPIEDEAAPLYVLEADALKNMLDDLRHVDGHHDTSPQLVLIEEWRRDRDPVAIDETFHQTD